MRSWKQKKIRDERRKARRRGKQRFARSGCFKMPAYIGPAASRNLGSLESSSHKGAGLLEKLRKISWRRIFRNKK